MIDPLAPALRLYLVQYPGDEVGAKAERLADVSDALADLPSTSPAVLDPTYFQLLVLPPNKAAAEIVPLKPDLSDATDVLTRTIQSGYGIHGPGYFDAIQKAINSPLANANQGSQQPQLQLSGDQLGKLIAIAAKAIADENEKILAAAAAVQAFAATWATQRLKESRDIVLAQAQCYFREIQTAGDAEVWLSKDDKSPGARASAFDEGIVNLAQSIRNLLPLYVTVTSADVRLADTMKKAGRQMQRVAGDRWSYLRGQDPKNTPGASKTRSSKDYGVELLDASNPVHPEFVRQAEELFPDPSVVVTARGIARGAMAALTAGLIGEGAVHPILYRIWTPALAVGIEARLRNTVIDRVDASFLQGNSDLRLAMTDALRSTYVAAGGLIDKLKDPRNAWTFPLLIRGALDEMKLGEDHYQRVVAEHLLVAAAEEAERKNLAFQRVSEVLAGAQLLIRYIPAPEVTLPVSLILGVIDSVVGGIALLYQYVADSDTRDGFRAFLTPSDSFAASDGSYLGVVLGAAVMLFGLVGLKRTTITPPTKTEIGIAAGAIAHQEYKTLSAGAKK